MNSLTELLHHIGLIIFTPKCYQVFFNEMDFFNGKQNTYLCIFCFHLSLSRSYFVKCHFVQSCYISIIINNSIYPFSVYYQLFKCLQHLAINTFYWFHLISDYIHYTLNKTKILCILDIYFYETIKYFSSIKNIKVRIAFYY